MAVKKAAKKATRKAAGKATKTAKTAKAAARKRELIQPRPGDKRYVRRDDEGHFTDDQVDVGRSLSQDRRRTSKTTAKSGQGDKGDRKR